MSIMLAGQQPTNKWKTKGYLILALLGILAAQASRLPFILGECEPSQIVSNNFITSCRDESLILSDGRRITTDHRLCKKVLGRWVCGRPNKVQLDPTSGGLKLGSDMVVMQSGDVVYGNGLVHYWEGTISIDNLNCWERRFFICREENVKVKLTKFLPTSFPYCAKITPLYLLCMFKDGTFRVTTKRLEPGQQDWKVETWVALQGKKCAQKIIEDPGEREMFERY